jgi:uncharacterized protein involved in exopolysaccharide biosynthesis
MRELQNSVEPQCIEEDEIDLRELFETIKKGKKTIFLVTTIIVFLTLIYALSVPNTYKSEAILIPVEQEGGSGLGSLGGLAAMAGVSLGGGSMTPDVAFSSLLDDYSFMHDFVLKNKIVAHYTDEHVDENYVFALGFRGLYDLFKSAPDEEQDEEEIIYNTVQKIKKQLSVSADKKSGLITISFQDHDRTYAPKVVNAFLKDASNYLVNNNLAVINSKLHYFEKEMRKAQEIELRTNLSQMISNILKEKVMTKSKEYYKCDVLTKPSVAYIKDKTKPKRGLILVVAFVTSIILGVFLVFFLEFIRNSKSEK